VEKSLYNKIKELEKKAKKEHRKKEGFEKVYWLGYLDCLRDLRLFLHKMKK